jgi:hypothetical protein
MLIGDSKILILFSTERCISINVKHEIVLEEKGRSQVLGIIVYYLLTQSSAGILSCNIPTQCRCIQSNSSD